MCLLVAVLLLRMGVDADRQIIVDVCQLFVGAELDHEDVSAIGRSKDSKNDIRSPSFVSEGSASTPCLFYADRLVQYCTSQQCLRWGNILGDGPAW